eukprot:COSAG01_NODE_5071_length_4507_cov_1.789927_6_plen_228_part_00
MGATGFGTSVLLAVVCCIAPFGSDAIPVAEEMNAGQYKRLQYIGFPIETGYNGYLSQNMLFYGEDNGVGSYVGLEDIQADIDARVDIMGKAINASASNSSVDVRKDTLKVFLAPEFFFRGPKGAYHAEAPPLMHIGQKLANLVRHPRFEDWVFVFGSIIVRTQSVALFLAPAADLKYAWSQGFNENANLTAALTGVDGGEGNSSNAALQDTYNFAIIQVCSVQHPSV